MLKDWKSLFVKDETPSPEEEKKAIAPQEEGFAFTRKKESESGEIPVKPLNVNQSIVDEIMAVYENGLDKLNMPGYDFFEFYQAIYASNQFSESAFQMAFQMSQALEKSVTKPKLLNDADYYISKIDEVYKSYMLQGDQKLKTISDKKLAENNRLNTEINEATAKIQELKTEINRLETMILDHKSKSNQLENNIGSDEQAVKDKLSANDVVYQTIIGRLNKVKLGVQNYL